MAIDSDIRDQAYQFFIQEAPELLEVIEAELLTLRQERSTAKIHNMMRAAHSIKGGAASVGLETIKTLAHSLEDIFKGLHNEKLEIDAGVEGLLLQAYDCLRFPLIEQITAGQFNSDQAMAMAEPVFAQIETRIGHFLREAANLPSSVELGVDIALSIFEVDVAQGLERIATVLAAPQGNEVAGELRAQAEVFAGLAELLNLPGFGAIAETALAALDAHPDQALHITQITLADFQAAQEAVLAGDRTQGGAPSNALAELAHLPIAPSLGGHKAPPLLSPSSDPPAEDANIFSLGDVFADFTLSTEAPAQDLSPLISVTPLVEEASTEGEAELDLSPVTSESENTFISALDDVFGDFALSTEAPAQDLSPLISVTPLAEQVDVSPVASESENTSISALDDVFGNFVLNSPATLDSSPAIPVTSAPAQPKELHSDLVKAANIPTPQLSVRVDLERLELMNNLVGELAINRNGLSLQNEQLQATVQELLRRFAKFREMSHDLRELSDQMLVAPERYGAWIPGATGQVNGLATNGDSSSLLSGRESFRQADFDSLEMDSYGELHPLLQATLEQIVQVEETVGDVVLLAGQSNQTLERQRQMLGHLRDDLMWVRMLPLSEVLNRFPRILRSLSTSYDKPVELKLSGTGVLVDKAALEKLYDPLVHLLRNAFDHGIEPPDVRTQQGKRSPGQIEIRAYHQGSQTIIEVRDDGRGINLDRVRRKALDLGLLSPEQLATTSTSRLFDLLFEPGFSTASQISELSGRGVGLDVVRSQLRSLKGTVNLTSEPGQGTTFTLHIPLTLTIAKLLVCFVNSTPAFLTNFANIIAQSLVQQRIDPDQSEAKKTTLC